MSLLCFVSVKAQNALAVLESLVQLPSMQVFLVDPNVQNIDDFDEGRGQYYVTRPPL